MDIGDVVMKGVSIFLGICLACLLVGTLIVLLD